VILLFLQTAFAQHVANPYASAIQYANPDYTTEVNTAIAAETDKTVQAQMMTVENYSTAVWLDHIGAITGGDPTVAV